MMGIFRRKPAPKSVVDDGGKGIKENGEKPVGQQKVSEMDSTTKARYTPSRTPAAPSSLRMRQVKENVRWSLLLSLSQSCLERGRYPASRFRTTLTWCILAVITPLILGLGIMTILLRPIVGKHAQQNLAAGFLQIWLRMILS